MAEPLRVLIGRGMWVYTGRQVSESGNAGGEGSEEGLHMACMPSTAGRGVEFKYWQVMLQLCSTLVRRHLEYSVELWVARPH